MTKTSSTTNSWTAGVQIEASAKTSVKWLGTGGEASLSVTASAEMGREFAT